MPPVDPQLPVSPRTIDIECSNCLRFPPEGVTHETTQNVAPDESAGVSEGDAGPKEEPSDSPHARRLAAVDPSSADTMPCYTPLKAYRAPGGTISFDSKSGWSDRPLEFRCGHCIGCRTDQSRAWALRMVHESLMHEANSFVTLTYDDEHLPNDGGLHVEDWQLFAKRLRKAIGPFRFYHCGEYGPNTNRPHYHAAIFGHDFATDRLLLRRTKRSDLYTSSLLQQTWGLGYTTVGNLTYDSAAYVARYCMKKLTGNLAAEEYGDLRPPYATMSLKPGLGATWLQKYMTDVYPSDEVVHQGRKFRPPKYYDAQLHEAALRELKAKRLRHMNTDETTHQRLRVREKVHLARIQQRSTEQL